MHTALVRQQRDFAGAQNVPVLSKMGVNLATGKERIRSMVSIGVLWPHQEPEQLVLFKARILAEIKGKKIYFFDSTTHPLGKPELRHEA